jgi:hypothetical protein
MGDHRSRQKKTCGKRYEGWSKYAAEVPYHALPIIELVSTIVLRKLAEKPEYSGAHGMVPSECPTLQAFVASLKDNVSLYFAFISTGFRRARVWTGKTNVAG